jgi:hypothetical protein
MGWASSLDGEQKNLIFLGKAFRKRALERVERRWKDKIKMELRVVSNGGLWY